MLTFSAEICKPLTKTFATTNSNLQFKTFIKRYLPNRSGKQYNRNAL